MRKPKTRPKNRHGKNKHSKSGHKTHSRTPAATQASALAVPAETKPEPEVRGKTGGIFALVRLLQEARDEVSRVVWPTRKETLMATGVVLVMVVLATIFLSLADVVLSNLVRLILGFGA